MDHDTIDPRQPRLLDRNAIEDASAQIPDWLRTSYATFQERVLAKDYPCVFATAGQQRGELRYTWASSPTDPALPRAVAAFCELSAAQPKTRLALVIFVEPSAQEGGASHDANRAAFWQTLTHIHQNDPVAWPEGQATDPTDPLWEFCAFGVPSFVFGAAPSYTRRRARDLGPGLLLLLQPRTVFRGIEGGTKGGDKARRIIRDRLVKYDGVPAHVDFGSYGDPSTHEWKQYFVTDGDEKELGVCPFEYQPVREASLDPGGAAQKLSDVVPSDCEVKLQHDAPRTKHSWHRHGRSERLTVVEGGFSFRTLDAEWCIQVGDSVELPKGLLHESEAGPDGAIYVVQELEDAP